MIDIGFKTPKGELFFGVFFGIIKGKRQ